VLDKPSDGVQESKAAAIEEISRALEGHRTVSSWSQPQTTPPWEPSLAGCWW
jgi:hypothetical protein